MEISIEKLQKSKLEIASRIYMEVFNSFGEKWTISNSRKYLNEIYSSRFSYSAVTDGEMIGFLCAIPVTTEEHTWLFVDAIVVKNEFQNHGVGKILWEKAIDDAAKSGISGIRLFANPKYASFSWYKKLGLFESGWVEMKRLFSS